MNQVLMRSINTSIAAVLPVLSLLILGAGILGAVALSEFALALLVGLITGSYSSIFIAAPLLAMFKEREPRYRTSHGRRMRTGAELERLGARRVADAQPSASREPVAAGRSGAPARSPARLDGRSLRAIRRDPCKKTRRGRGGRSVAPAEATVA